MNGWERTKWVLAIVERHKLPPTASILLVALTTHADNTTAEASPTKKTLGRRTNLSMAAKTIPGHHHSHIGASAPLEPGCDFL
jgi:hypothetical protein